MHHASSLITDLPSVQQSGLWRDQGTISDFYQVMQEARTSADQGIWQVIQVTHSLSPSKGSLRQEKPLQLLKVILLMPCISSSPHNPFLTTYIPPLFPQQALHLTYFPVARFHPCTLPALSFSVMASSHPNTHWDAPTFHFNSPNSLRTGELSTPGSLTTLMPWTLRLTKLMTGTRVGSSSNSCSRVMIDRLSRS